MNTRTRKVTNIIYIKNNPKIKIFLIEVWSKLLCLILVNYLLFFNIMLA